MSANLPPATIACYDVLFAQRTGVTVLLEYSSVLDPIAGCDLSFALTADSSGDVLIRGAAQPVILKNMKKNHIDEAVKRGFILFYEMRKDDVVRSTLCTYASS